jgi:hypothetical protein
VKIVTPGKECATSTMRGAPVKDNRSMRLSYTPTNGAGLTYDIDADRHGNYTVKLDGKVVKRVSALPAYLGKPRWGSKQLEVDAVADAKQSIEALKTDHG